MTKKNMFNQTPPTIEVDETFIIIRGEKRRTGKTLTVKNKRKAKGCRRKNKDIFKK